jgi:hypothetical protein
VQVGFSKFMFFMFLQNATVASFCLGGGIVQVTLSKVMMFFLTVPPRT